MATPNVDEFSCMTIITVGQHNNWCRRVPMDCLSLRGGSDQIAAIWPRRLFAPAATHGNTLTLSYVRWRHHLLLPPKSRRPMIASLECRQFSRLRGRHWISPEGATKIQYFGRSTCRVSGDRNLKLAPFKKKKKKTKEERLLGMFRIYRMSMKHFFHRLLQGK